MNNAPLWLKTFGLIVIVVLVLNLVLMAMQRISMSTFWIVIIVLGGGSWLLVKVLNRKKT